MHELYIIPRPISLSRFFASFCISILINCRRLWDSGTGIHALNRRSRCNASSCGRICSVPMPLANSAGGCPVSFFLKGIIIVKTFPDDRLQREVVIFRQARLCEASEHLLVGEQPFGGGISGKMSSCFADQSSKSVQPVRHGLNPFV